MIRQPQAHREVRIRRESAQAYEKHFPVRVQATFVRLPRRQGASRTPG